ncbi:UDP-glucuronosyltransferase 1-1 [Folsomia candida]|uniref:UDP-glucuronosyltransferase n=1 Tax=Folsomia candida TaxID=158441 RepID=A0A226EXL9_FOLCA|nr:UDP-glucuronosyltransferase 1-1 [Folsomia candida]
MSSIFGFVLYLLASLACNVDGENILFLHAFGSRSHRISMMPLANALVSRGHNITYIAAVPAENPNPKMVDIIPKDFTAFIKNTVHTLFDARIRASKQGPIPMTKFAKLFAHSCSVLLTSSEFQAWLQTSPKIDLVVMDLIPDCGLGIAHKLNAKAIVYSTLPMYSRTVETVKIPPEALTPYGDHVYNAGRMTFFDKIKQVLMPLLTFYYEYVHAPAFELILQQGLNITNMPTLHDLYNNVSVVFMAGNYITELPRSLPPMFVAVPGLHLQAKSNALPKEIEEFIENEDGFVYISFGTVVVAHHLPIHIQNVFMDTIRAFPRIQFLWRWDGELPKNMPDNLYMSKWFPQQDVLGHPKIRAFITQAGRPSLQEALVNAVPMITLPFHGDQDFNAMRLDEIGVSIPLEISEITEQQLQSALTRALYDTEFRKNVKKMSNIFTDLPMKPIDTAVWWTEYVLRHEDVSYLKPMGRNLTWSYFPPVIGIGIKYLQILAVLVIVALTAWMIYIT